MECYLLFDSGCSLCTSLARQVEEAADGKLTARSLRDPEVRSILDEAKPDWRWEPMLLEVDGNRRRVYAGVGMRARLVGSRLFLTPVLLIGFISLFYFVFVQILSSVNSPRDEGPLRRSLLFIIVAFVLNVLFVDGLNIFLPNTLRLWHHLLNTLLALIQFGFLFFLRSEISNVPKMDRNVPAVHWVTVGTLWRGVCLRDFYVGVYQYKHAAAEL